MKPPYNYGISQEDERTESAALGLPGGRVLSIASAGDMPLSLLALGAKEVVAIDMEPGQLYLGELKLAAVLNLERCDAIRFLGYMPAKSVQRARWLDIILNRLPSAARDFWRSNGKACRKGPIWLGRYERYVGLLRSVMLPLAGAAVRGLVKCGSLDEQKELFDRTFDRAIVRALFRLAFSRSLYYGAGISRLGLMHQDRTESLGARFFSRFRAMCVCSPARDNPLLQLHLLGRVINPWAVPEYLTARGVEAIRGRRHAISFVHAPLSGFLESSRSGKFNKFHLSNVPDWMSESHFDHVVELITRKADKPARLVWRYLHRNPDVSAGRSAGILVDGEMGRILESRDRFPLYGVVPAAIPEDHEISSAGGCSERDA